MPTSAPQNHVANRNRFVRRCGYPSCRVAVVARFSARCIPPSRVRPGLSRRSPECIYHQMRRSGYLPTTYYRAWKLTVISRMEWPRSDNLAPSFRTEKEQIWEPGRLEMAQRLNANKMRGSFADQGYLERMFEPLVTESADFHMARTSSRLEKK